MEIGISLQHETVKNTDTMPRIIKRTMKRVTFFGLENIPPLKKVESMIFHIFKSLYIILEKQTGQCKSGQSGHWVSGYDWSFDSIEPDAVTLARSLCRALKICSSFSLIMDRSFCS